jgi:hypothetical protein
MTVKTSNMTEIVFKNYTIHPQIRRARTTRSDNRDIPTKTDNLNPTTRLLKEEANIREK